MPNYFSLYFFGFVLIGLLLWRAYAFYRYVQDVKDCLLCYDFADPVNDVISRNFNEIRTYYRIGTQPFDVAWFIFKGHPKRRKEDAYEEYME